MVILRFVAPPLRRVTARSFSTAPPKRAQSPSKFQFHLSTAFHGKPTEADDPPSSSRSQRRPKQKLLQGFAPDSPIARWRDNILNKVAWTAGHDWYFTSTNSTTQNVAIGIADGVGGWEDSGVDPSHFSQALMYHCEMAVESSAAKGTAKDPAESLSPTDIMTIGFAGVTEEKGVIAGSSTACVITLDAATGILDAANLGDSTFILVRNDQVIHSQPAQTHYFNAPRQLSKMPAGNRGDGNFMDLPKDADVVRLQLQNDDILLLVTDGFSDNVFNREVEQLVNLVVADTVAKGEADDKAALIEKIANACVHFARLCSFKVDKESPFEVEARQHGLEFRGGKVDDVCVVAVLVQATPRAKL